MNWTNYVETLVAWLEETRCKVYGAEGYVLGVSGGVDSAVCAHLLAHTGAPVTAVMLPGMVARPQDLADAQKVLESAGLVGEVVSIADICASVLAATQALLGQAEQRYGVLHGNLQARARMLALYTIAQSRSGVVVGTDNAAEWYMGYFTKFGDGGADVVPLLHLRKEEVFSLARHLGVPAEVCNKAPSAGLWEGQTDEDEMGVSYREIDAFLRGEPVSAAARARIDYWHQRSHHKRQLPCVPPKPQARQ